MNAESTASPGGPANPPLILASGSPFRRELLGRLGLAFDVVSPDIDERPQSGETAEALACRLAETKARAVGEDRRAGLIIGSDQVAALSGRVLGKPGGHEAALAQLTAAAGHTVRFLTAVALLNSATGRLQLELVPYSVVFRRLDRDTLERYLERERPYDCAGAFKSEGLGIALTERMSGDDPTALIGLPLTRLTRMLAEEGVDII